MPDPSSQTPLFLTTKEVADLLRVKERKVYDLAAANEIPHRRITGKLLFPAEALKRWIDGPDEDANADRPTVLAGSHDPLLDWAIRASGCGFATLCNGSRDGLDQFQSRQAAAAGLHLPQETGWNTDAVQEAGVTGAVLIHWAVRTRGLLVSEDAAPDIKTLANLKGKRIAMRQPGAGAAILFTKLLTEAGLSETDILPAAYPAHTESDAAAAVAAQEADAALGLKAMARQFKLPFLPLVAEQFDLLIDRKSYFTPAVQTLLAFARTSAFQEKAVTLGGYDIDGLGSVRWISP